MNAPHSSSIPCFANDMNWTAGGALLHVKGLQIFLSGSHIDLSWKVTGIGKHLSDTRFEISLLISSSVYCIELCRTSTGEDFVITGSRDKTMKVWFLNSGKCLGTFGSGVVGGELPGHRGSVLCIKFFWEVEGKKGIVYSGSSDSTVCIWDLWVVKTSDGETEVLTKVRAVLREHGGGVLDLKVVDNWIITWYIWIDLFVIISDGFTSSKDSIIRIWNRETLELFRTLRGHDGPVNAVCAEDGKLVSASGDGKLILWDIVSGERMKTLEGHDRGLACIEFKVGTLLHLRFPKLIAYRTDLSSRARMTARSRYGPQKQGSVYARCSVMMLLSVHFRSTR